MNGMTDIEAVSSLKGSTMFRRLSAAPLWSAVIVSFVSILVLVGWSFEVDFLKRIIPGYVFMNPTTAVSFILSSVALLLLQSADAWRTRIAQVCAAVVLLVGLIKLCAIIGLFDFGIDQILFRDRLFDYVTGQPNRMAPNTALNFLLLGAALLLINAETKRRDFFPAQYPTIVVILTSFLAIIGYLYGTKSFYVIVSFNPMAIHTAASFLLLAIGLLLLKPERGLIKEIFSLAIGGHSARRLFPVITIIPLVLGWLQLKGEHFGLYAPEIGFAMVTVAISIILGAIVLNNARLMNNAAAVKLRQTKDALDAEAAIAEANERAIHEYERLIDRVAQLAESLGTARDLQTIYHALYSFAVISMPCNGFFISLYDAQRNVRIPAFGRCEEDELDVSDLPVMEMSGSPNSRAISTDSIIIEDDFQAAMAGKSVIHIGLDKHSDLPQSCLVAPMSVMGRVVGAVEVQSNMLAAYTKEHATAMRMAANLAASAIENVRLIEQERERAEQLRLSQKLESVGRLAGGIAHDFNNMLTAINGYSELTLRRLGKDNPLRANVEEIKKAGERSAALTHQLLAFSRKQVLQSRVLDLNEVVNDTLQMLKRLIGENIRLETTLDSKLGRIEADPGQLAQVLMNLAVNARDAMPEGGNLTIETANVRLDKEYVTQHFSIKPGCYILLAVSDTGAGIDAETQQHIFEPFFTTKETGKGTGLGLATVYGIVKQSGGYIWVDSEPEHGTSFKIYLPRVDEQIADEAETSELENAPKGAETVLVVEDEDIVRALTRQILEESGYAVIEARNGVEALSICKDRDYKIDLLMTDVVMPQMGGRELAEKMGRIQPDLRVLFTSGYTDDAVIRHNVIEADTNFIQKPFTFDALAHKVRDSLDSEN